MELFQPWTFRTARSSADKDSLTAKKFIDAGDKMVVDGRARATGRGSGLQLENDVALVWTARNGMLIRTEVFTDRRDALEAAGLPTPPPGS
jgi:ketosteroid isomerase-like protein